MPRSVSHLGHARALLRPFLTLASSSPSGNHTPNQAFRLLFKNLQTKPFSLLTEPSASFILSVMDNMNTAAATTTANRAVTYFKGDMAEYTGKVLQLHGGTFYEVILLEGIHKGASRVVVNAPRR